MNIKILARCGEFDIEIIDEVDSVENIPSYINSIIHNSPEIKPRPRFQNNQVKVELPFVGTVDKTELVPAKDGKKEYCLAHIKHEDGSIVPVRYFPPQKTWKSGEKANVVKGTYGPELKEVSDDSEPPF